MRDIGRTTPNEKRGQAETAPGETAPSEHARSEVRRAAEAGVLHDFHAPSRTHIVWCPGIGRGGVKGFGDMADEARRDFECRLRTLLSTAGAADLERWRGRLGEDEAERRREQHVRSLAARERMGEYSISLDPAQSASIRKSIPAGAANAAIVDALRGGLELVRKEARGRKEAEMRSSILDQEAALKATRRANGADLDVRTVRMDAETHARLHLEAHELGVKLPELCRYAVTAWLRQSGLGRSAPVAGVARNAGWRTSAPARRVGTGGSGQPPDASLATVVDPFEDLGTVAFADVARSAGVNPMFLGRVRDRQIDPATMPDTFLERLCGSLPGNIPFAAMAAFLDGAPRLPPRAMFKSGKQPRASGRVSFESAVRSSGLSDGEQQALLSMSAAESSL